MKYKALVSAGLACLAIGSAAPAFAADPPPEIEMT
jgi:hypothetical protein